MFGLRFLVLSEPDMFDLVLLGLFLLPGLFRLSYLFQIFSLMISLLGLLGVVTYQKPVPFRWNTRAIGKGTISAFVVRVDYRSNQATEEVILI